MISWLKKFDEKPDHPMSDVKEAKKLLADLPKDNAFKALEEVTFWLASVKDAQGFRPETRAEIIMLLDETGQPLHAELLRLYLSAPHLQDFQGLHQWQGMHGFMRALAEAYAVCVHEYRQAEKKPWDLKENMPVICIRLLRAVAEQMKLELMRYVEVEQLVWDQMCSCYSFAEANQIADTMVFPYPGHVIHTSPQRELARAMMLYVSSPGSLAPDQIEVSYRIDGRLASFFDFKAEPDPDCAHFLDLSKPGAPGTVDSNLRVTPTMRFFGAVKAHPKVEGIISQNEQGLFEQERRFGSEFTPAGKLTVLKHLQMYWGKDQPHRHQERRGISTDIEVIHSFRTISKLVARIDLDHVVNLSEEDAAALKERSKINLADDDDVKYTTEAWTVLDVSADGIGGMLPKATGTWVKIGDLCGLKAKNSQLWWVGMIRRLKTDSKGMVHVGIEILAKKPLSVWLRALGKGAEKVSNWETSSGSFEYDYLPVILLPDAYNSYVNATMLMESGSYVSGTIYQVMMGEKSRDIELTGLLAEGEDYEQVSFKWLDPAHV
ncbi:MAG: hypothetical protein A3K04_08470 [Gallionellales bacterium RBG_16_56_9]|nr:MAG: hypothetical protein A3K04_08470 [Gallionellales bacterium RBG_16_56_9]